mmetsp:Transcript_23574/g.93447  ORF Transcript_23574/g.93447 Transcript_23574/m.93447 type:complete len:225 (-) Transcript_23574:319-993(-)
MTKGDQGRVVEGALEVGIGSSGVEVDLGKVREDALEARVEARVGDARGVGRDRVADEQDVGERGGVGVDEARVQDARAVRQEEERRPVDAEPLFGREVVVGGGGVDAAELARDERALFIADDGVVDLDAGALAAREERVAHGEREGELRSRVAVLEDRPEAVADDARRERGRHALCRGLDRREHRGAPPRRSFERLAPARHGARREVRGTTARGGGHRREPLRR